MKVLFFAYPLYADFEVAHTLFFLRKVGKASVTIATIDGKPVESLGGIVTQPHKAIDHVQPQNYDLILISGGDGISEVLGDERITDFLMKAHEKQKPIAAICASATLLAQAGLLRGKKFTCTPNTYERFYDIFQDAAYTGKRIEILDNIITAKGTAFPEFTIAVLDMLNLWKDEEQRKGALLFCKGEV